MKETGSHTILHFLGAPLPLPHMCHRLFSGSCRSKQPLSGNTSRLFQKPRYQQAGHKTSSARPGVTRGQQRRGAFGFWEHTVSHELPADTPHQHPTSPKTTQQQEPPQQPAQPPSSHESYCTYPQKVFFRNTAVKCHFQDNFLFMGPVQDHPDLPKIIKKLLHLPTLHLQKTWKP